MITQPDTQVRLTSKELCQIDVALKSCSKTSLKELYTRPEGCQDVWLFLVKKQVLVVPVSRGEEITGMELAGSATALQSFYDEFLIDEPVQALKLHYRPD